MASEVHHCTICTGEKHCEDPKADLWPGYYRGCICLDKGGVYNGWSCDGDGRLTKASADGEI